MYIYGRVNSIIRLRSLYAKACNWKVAIWSSFLHGKCQLSTCPPVDSRFCYGKRLMSTEEWVDSYTFHEKLPTANLSLNRQNTVLECVSCQPSTCHLVDSRLCYWKCQLSTVDLFPGRHQNIDVEISSNHIYVCDVRTSGELVRGVFATIFQISFLGMNITSVLKNV